MLHFRRATELRADYFDAWLNLGTATAEAHQYDQALAVCTAPLSHLLVDVIVFLRRTIGHMCLACSKDTRQHTWHIWHTIRAAPCGQRVGSSQRFSPLSSASGWRDLLMP